MSITEQEEQEKLNLNEALSRLVAITPESLGRTNELGTAFSFQSGVDVFERTLRLFRQLHETNLDHVPIEVLQQLRKSVDQAITHFEQIRTFDPAAQNNPAQARDALIQQIAEQYNHYFTRLAPTIAYSVRRGTDFQQLETNARNALGEIQRLKGENEKAAATILAEINATLEQVRRAAAEVGVAQHAIHFREEANLHEARSATVAESHCRACSNNLAFRSWERMGISRLSA